MVQIYERFVIILRVACPVMRSIDESGEQTDAREIWAYRCSSRSLVVKPTSRLVELSQMSYIQVVIEL